MAEMNRGTKKLIALLEKEAKNLKTSLTNELISSVIDTVRNYQNSTNNVADPTNIDFINNTINDHADNFIDSVHDDMYLKIEINQVLKALEGEHLFLLFDSLEDIFEHFNFPVKYQLDVLGYVIKRNAEMYKEAEISIAEDEKELKNDEEYSKIFDEELKLFGSSVLEKIGQELKDMLNSPEFKETKNEVFENYEIVASHIDGNCRFKPTTDLFALHHAMVYANVGLTERQEKLIIWDVSEKQLRKFDEEFEKEIEKETIKGRVYETNVDLNKKNKEQNVAEHELKKYLVDDSPVSFVDELMFAEIKRLMNQAGYTEERINKVVKNIVNSNQSLYEQDSISKFKSASSNYLTVEEQEILSNAEQILNNKDALVNPSFNTILENYNIVKEEIVTVSDEEDEALELVRYAIEEIRNAVIEYSYSDYRVTRILKENKK